MSEKLYRNEEWLRENYRRTAKTKKELAEEVGIEWPPTISKWLNRHDIVKLHNDVEWVREKYCEERLNGREIADIIPYDVSAASVQRTIRENDIERNYQSEDWLREKYCGTQNSMQDVADMAGVALSAIAQSLERNGIETVSVEDRWDVYDNPLKGVTGEDHHHYDPDRVDQDWRHSSEWNQMKKKVRERDNYTCQICESQPSLHVHHIVPVNEGGLKFDPCNLMVLCESCHRDVHSEYYRSNTVKDESDRWIQNNSVGA